MPLYTIGTPLQGKGDEGRRRGELRRVRHTPFAWDGECQYAFDTLKNALGNSPVLGLLDREAKYCLHVDASQYALGAVLSQVQDKTEEVLGYFSRELHDAETRYPAYDRELLRIQDAILYCKFNLHRAEQPFLAHTDHSTLRWILTQLHLTVRQMDIWTVLQNFTWEVKHILGVRDQGVDALSRSPDFRWERCNLTALAVNEAGEWVDDIKAGTIDDQWFGAYCTLLVQPKFSLPAIHCIDQGRQIMGGNKTILFGREWPTVVMWRCGKDTVELNCKGKRERGRPKGRYERMVEYSKDNAATNPP